MEELIRTIEWAKEQIKTAKDDIDTYEDDGQADHGDGRYCGRVEAYKSVIRFCASQLAAIK